MNHEATEILLKQKAGEPLCAALNDLLNHDAYLLEVDANERSITCRLAMYLQSYFPGLHVDCEYNRDGIDPKKIQYLDIHPEDEDADAKTVFPDIIVHQRGTNKNYLVIEVKKSSNTADRSTDRAKLRGYRKNLEFEFAIFIELATKEQADISYVEWIDP